MAETLPAPTTLIPARLPATGMMGKMRGFTSQPAVARALPMIGVIAALGLAALMWMTLHTAPQRTLFGGLGDADKQAVAEALGSAGIAYEVDNGTGALSVDESKFYQAKMLLAAQGLPKAAPSGEETLASLPMGASRAVEGERLRSAHEMDLARTIEAIDAVENAKVHLAVEAPSVFVRDAQKATASVMLKLRGGRTLSNAQVQAIVHLVASSEPGLTPDAVSVVDQSGRLLSAPSDAGEDASDKQVALQNRIEDRYKQQLAALLTPMVGEGNFTAEVHADLAFDEVAATRETYPKDTAVVRQEQGSWTNKEAGQGNQPPVGIPGALSNQAPAQAQVAAAPNGAITPTTPGGQAGAAVTGKLEETYNRTFDVGREVSVTRTATGTVRRLSVAVALKNVGGKPRTPAETAAIEALVKGAVGFDQQRGDVVAVSARTFVDNAPVVSAWYEAPWLPMVGRNVAGVLAAAFVVFGIARPLMKKRAAAAAERKAEANERRAAIAEEITATIATQASHDPDEPVTLAMIEAAPSYQARAQLIRNFVKQNPDRAALVVRDLIRSDMAEAA
jgi:flagellar M-ring protein FliF